MGYAKYREDIEKIHSLNIFGTYLDFQSKPFVPQLRCPFCSFETQVKGQFEAHLFTKHRDAAVYLEHDGRIVPERALFSVRPVHLKVRCLALADGVHCTVRSSLKPLASRKFFDGELLAITPPDEDTVAVCLTVGQYKREYGIAFKQKVFSAKLTARLLTGVDAANNGIHDWKWPELEQFKRDLVSEPELGEDGKRHRYAIWEYYFGLFLEQEGKPEYVRHLEKAFEVLKDFDEPLAQLISNYFLYRVNLFARIPRHLPFPQLRRVARFFCGEATAETSGNEAGSEITPCEIAVTDFDAAVFGSITLLLSGKPAEAAQPAQVAESVRTKSDDQALFRLVFLEYQLARALGRMEVAKTLAKRLSLCGVESFSMDAEAFLRKG